MAPPARKQPTRTAPTPTANTATAAQTIRQNDALTDFQTRRLNRRLEDLERTNPTDIPASSFAPSDAKSAVPGAEFGAVVIQGLGDKGKKKQSGNVKKILYAKKGLKDWLEELPSDPIPPYITAAAPPPTTPARKLCSSCGYTGAYRCPRCAEWSCDKVCLDVHQRDGGCGVGG